MASLSLHRGELKKPAGGEQGDLDDGEKIEAPPLEQCRMRERK